MSFFKKKEGYETKEVNGFVLEKRMNSGTWTVAVYTRDSFMKAQQTFNFLKSSQLSKMVRSQSDRPTDNPTRL